MSEHEKLREAITWGRAYHAAAYVSLKSNHLAVLVAAAESTLPKTKMVEVWRLEYAHRGIPCAEVYQAKHHADGRAAELKANRDGSREVPAFSCIRVTGPHQQEVPDASA